MATTDSLMFDARCIDSCIPAGMQLAALISLFQKVAGVSLTTDQLMDGAKCIDSCIPRGMQLPVLISLAQTIVANGGGGGGGGGSGSVLQGTVDPVAPPASPNSPALYTNLTSGTLFTWNVTSQSWV